MREAEALQAAVVGERERDERGGRAAGGLDRVGELLEAADGAGHRDDLGAAGAERARDGVAEAAAGAGDERDLALGRVAHALTLSRKPCSMRSEGRTG